MARRKPCKKRDGSLKVAYASREQAERNMPTNQHAYDCPKCPFWHRGTNAPSAPR